MSNSFGETLFHLALNKLAQPGCTPVLTYPQNATPEERTRLFWQRVGTDVLIDWVRDHPLDFTDMIYYDNIAIYEASKGKA